MAVPGCGVAKACERLPGCAGARWAVRTEIAHCMVAPADAMAGTEIAYGAADFVGDRSTHSPAGIALRACYAMSGPEISCAVSDSVCGIALRQLMSGTRTAYQSVCAMSGTDIANIAIGLRACYAMSGADMAYGSCVRSSCYE
eukprot:867396-Rhodomonas_salina.1